MRKLYLGNGDKQFKFADTTTEIHLNAFDDGSAATLTENAKVRIKNDSGYLLGISANITNNHAVITSGQLAQLPVGSYLLELWDTVNGGNAIYPSDGFLALQINENITGLSGGLVSSITVDDFIKHFSDLSQQLKQQVAVAIANGLKGDKGDNGLSAYQIAVINGYHGSQTDWLASLVGAKGDTGEKGNPGKDFKIVKTFPSIASMNGTGFSDGDFTMIASDVNDPDDGKLYVWNGTSFTYIADLSGSQGIKGDTGKTGDKGDKGDPGDQGLSAYQVAVNAGFSGSVNEWLASLVGPTGTVDNAGLISAPAFKSLQTQVNNSAVGINLIIQSDLKGGYISIGSGNIFVSGSDFYSDNYIPTNGVTVFTFSSPDYEFKGSDRHTLAMYDSDKKYLGYQPLDSPTQTLSKPNVAYIRFSINSADEGNNTANSSDWLANHRYKLEKGDVATDWCPNPSEILTTSDYAKIKAAIVALGGTLS